MTEGISDFRGDKAKLDELLRNLIDAKVLSVSDANLLYEAKSSNLSMRKKIAECVDIILHPEILPLLNTGLSVLYQVCLLAEDLDRDVDRVHEILSASDGPATRDYLMDSRQSLRKRAVALSPELGDAELSSAIAHSLKLDQSLSTVDPLVPEVDDDSPSQSGGITQSDISAPASAILLTPSKHDITSLKKDYFAEGSPACLRVKAAKDAALVIATHAADLQVFVDKLPCWGFGRISRVYLMAPPSNPDVTRASVIAVCERGSARVGGLESWPTEADAVRLAESILGDLPGRRLHLFAKDQASGWNTVVGDANWACEAEAVA